MRVRTVNLAGPGKASDEAIIQIVKDQAQEDALNSLPDACASKSQPDPSSAPDASSEKEDGQNLEEDGEEGHYFLSGRCPVGTCKYVRPDANVISGSDVFKVLDGIISEWYYRFNFAMPGFLLLYDLILGRVCIGMFVLSANMFLVLGNAGTSIPASLCFW